LAVTVELAEVTALRALGFLVADEDRLAGFLAASGTDDASLRAQAGSRDLAMAVLDFMLSDEALLLEFCDHESIDPRNMLRMRHILDGM
jgi:hypothetical protein